MDLSDLALLQRLAVDDDFYLAEAIGDAIARRPELELEANALACQQHSHPQAATAGSRGSSRNCGVTMSPESQIAGVIPVGSVSGWFGFASFEP
jgi:hypothetical protein